MLRSLISLHELVYPVHALPKEKKNVDINPEEVISNLSAQIGALTTENVMLKMALAKLQAQIDEEIAEED